MGAGVGSDGESRNRVSRLSGDVPPAPISAGKHCTSGWRSTGRWNQRRHVQIAPWTENVEVHWAPVAEVTEVHSQRGLGGSHRLPPAVPEARMGSFLEMVTWPA